MSKQEIIERAIYDAAYEQAEKAVYSEWYQWAMLLIHHIEQIGLGDDGVDVRKWLTDKSKELEKYDD